jgi:hypothetical protein
MQNLQKQLNSKSEDLEKFKMLFEAFWRGSDQQATALLARLRVGDSIDDLLSYLSADQQSSSR